MDTQHNWNIHTSANLVTDSMRSVYTKRPLMLSFS